MLIYPSQDDILKARLKTLGVTEYRFKMKAAGNAMNHDWRVYDVGGQRSLVSAALTESEGHVLMKRFSLAVLCLCELSEVRCSSPLFFSVKLFAMV